jgi:hypothetical protein
MTWRAIPARPYRKSHGAESLSGNIAHFLGYFVPRKLGSPSLNEMKVEPGTYYSPRHRLPLNSSNTQPLNSRNTLPLNSSNEGSQCVGGRGGQCLLVLKLRLARRC